jgi:ankyrin repeat protein
VKTLLAAKVEMDKIDNDGKTPLHKASSNGHLEVVTTLLA